MKDNPLVDITSVNIPKLPRLPRGGAMAVVTVLIVGVVGFSTLYQVQPEEVGVVLRFGNHGAGAAGQVSVRGPGAQSTGSAATEAGVWLPHDGRRGAHGVRAVGERRRG